MFVGIVFDLVSFGSIVNNTDNIFDQTVLSLAIIEYPNIDIAKYLLRKGARLKGSKQLPVVIGKDFWSFSIYLIFSLKLPEKLAQIQTLEWNTVENF